MLKRVKFKIVVQEIGYFKYPIFFWKKTVIGLHTKYKAIIEPIYLSQMLLRKNLQYILKLLLINIQTIDKLIIK